MAGPHTVWTPHVVSADIVLSGTECLPGRMFISSCSRSDLESTSVALNTPIRHENLTCLSVIIIWVARLNEMIAHVSMALAIGRIPSSLRRKRRRSHSAHHRPPGHSWYRGSGMTPLARLQLRPVPHPPANFSVHAPDLGFLFFPHLCGLLRPKPSVVGFAVSSNFSQVPTRRAAFPFLHLSSTVPVRLKTQASSTSPSPTSPTT